MADLADANDREAARCSLDAELRHWRSGEPLLARDWLAAELEGMTPLAQQLEMDRWLAPLHSALQEGNQAQQCIAAHAAGADVAALIAAGAAVMAERERELTALLATDGAASLG